MPVHVERVVATVRCRDFKIVNCENCRLEYVYLLCREAEAAANTMEVWDPDETTQLATDRANSELQQTMTKAQDAVPCPACGWYQQSMVPLIRAAHLAWMRFVGALLLYVAGILTALLIVQVVGARIQNEVPTYASLLQAAICFGCVGFGLIFVRRYLANGVDPNESDPDARIKLGMRLAKSKKEFDQLLGNASPPVVADANKRVE